MLLPEDDAEVSQGRMIGPQLARETLVLGRQREQEHVVDRQQRPDDDRYADQQQLGLVDDDAALHRDSRFIMKYTSGRTNGIATTIVAIARST